MASCHVAGEIPASAAQPLPCKTHSPCAPAAATAGLLRYVRRRRRLIAERVPSAWLGCCTGRGRPQPGKVTARLLKTQTHALLVQSAGACMSACCACRRAAWLHRSRVRSADGRAPRQSNAGSEKASWAAAKPVSGQVSPRRRNAEPVRPPRLTPTQSPQGQADQMTDAFSAVTVLSSA